MLLALLPSLAPGPLQAPEPAPLPVNYLRTYSEERGRAVHRHAARYGVPDTLAERIHDAASCETLDPDLLFRLIRTESSFRIDVVSRAGAVGLMQVLPSTARWLEPGVSRADLFDPDTNLRMGARYLRTLLDHYGGDLERALTAYNWGPTNVARGRYSDGYARRVLDG